MDQNDGGKNFWNEDLADLFYSIPQRGRAVLLVFAALPVVLILGFLIRLFAKIFFGMDLNSSTANLMGALVIGIPTIIFAIAHDFKHGGKD